MNEQQLIADTIEVLQKGWGRGDLVDGENKRCLLGAIGHARWGHQWDLDCNKASSAGVVYERLGQDPLTAALIRKISDTIVANQLLLNHSPSRADFDGYLGHYDNVMCFMFNDEQMPQTGAENVLALLEKVQADIGR